MNHLFIISAATVCLIFNSSCHEEIPKKEAIEPVAEKASIEFNNENLDTLTGVYFGNFGGSDIRIVLTHVGKSHVVGYNLLKGLRRNISGTYVKQGDTVQMTLAEPGDNEYDGVFEMEIYLDKFNGKGKWKANSEKISNKSFTFDKLPPFEYVEDLDKLNNSNFASTFNWVEDSLGSIRFQNDGSCVYEYYPTVDNQNRVEQKEEVKGSWTYKNKQVKIAWQANPIFPTRTSLLDAISEDYSFYLTCGGRTFYSINY